LIASISENEFVLLFLPFSYCYADGIARLFTYLGADILAKSDDVADRTVSVLNAHIDDANVPNRPQVFRQVK
jgi:hypothetical protein